MTGLNSLSPKYGAVHSKKRLGLGRGSGHGETSTRGQKGQTARSGNKKMEGMEGGQMPLVRRIPKSGFSNVMFARKYEWVNLGTLSKFFPSGSEVSPEALKKKGLVNSLQRVKILGDGKLEHPLKVTAHAFSKSAKEKIEKAGGTAVVAAQDRGTKKN